MANRGNQYEKGVSCKFKSTLLLTDILQYVFAICAIFAAKNIPPREKLDPATVTKNKRRSQTAQIGLDATGR